ncbi:MAG: DUF1638 domain-containing protein [Lachnospiraceae bacterium]|nr:DUF1638 domain-containing protein [Lachnospiraceae bacterium]
MQTKLLACATLKNELEFLCQRMHISYETIWIESGLHNRPELLHKRIQTELDQITDCDRLLVAFGNCGNALTDLQKGDYEMIIPRVDDCISLFFGSDAVRNAYGREHASIYLTQGWMDGESNIVAEYQHMLDKYGQETADSIIKMMYGHYKELALLDTGVTDIQCLVDETAKVEDIVHLTRRVVPVGLGYLERLLTGPWSEEEFRIFR